MKNHGQKQKDTKHEPNYQGIKAMPFVVGNEAFEKLGTIGSSSNLLVYLTSIFHMKTITATNVINIFNGTCNLGTLVGAFLCDTYFGRYNLLGFASVSSFLGMLMLTLTAAVSKLHPPACGEGSGCAGPSPGQLIFLISCLLLLVLGASGIRPCNLAFGADQFNPNTESGRRGITSFFNWYYLTYTFAMMVSLTIIVYIQSNVSWSIGFAIPAVLMFLSCAFFFLGTRIYVCVLPEGSPMSSVAQVVVAAIKKRKLKQPDDPKVSLFNSFSTASSINSRLPYTDQFRFLDKAAIITPEDEINSDGSPANPWRLCNVQQVERVKCILRVIPIWVACIVYFISVVQIQNYVVFEALQADRRFGTSEFKIPAASYIVVAMLALTIWVPIYDRLIVPWLRRVTGKEDGLTILQRIGIGFAFSVVTMIVSGLVESKRRSIALSKPTIGFEPKKGAISSMSGLWLSLPLVLSGISEGFAIIGENEFFYKQFPESMRSIGMAFIFVGTAVASYLSSLISSIIQSITGRSHGESWLAEDLNKGRLDYYYYLIGILQFLNLIYFLVCARWYKYKEAEDVSEVAVVKLQSEEKEIV
ncbi:protein NRT1/ PTR FAMILY 2.10 isoform X1 [Coffea arabica]|uniref:Protein NRT1/ PTR FAMILY 2.10 isoform X1 n=2 Tax=Coffea arabica TaxID=13443 RepID=A0A6P6X6C8_COFAR|nr:protein NRT1/ PTR FAMILY 2.10-like isoform X1 [Coffea arabica]